MFRSKSLPTIVYIFHQKPLYSKYTTAFTFIWCHAKVVSGIVAPMYDGYNHTKTTSLFFQLMWEHQRQRLATIIHLISTHNDMIKQENILQFIIGVAD